MVRLYSLTQLLLAWLVAWLFFGGPGVAEQTGLYVAPEHALLTLIAIITVSVSLVVLVGLSTWLLILNVNCNR